MLMRQLEPRYLFSAHMHVKYPAIYVHQDKSVTKFLALDKPLPGRGFLQFLTIQPKSSEKNEPPKPSTEKNLKPEDNEPAKETKLEEEKTSPLKNAKPISSKIFEVRIELDPLWAKILRITAQIFPFRVSTSFYNHSRYPDFITYFFSPIPSFHFP